MSEQACRRFMERYRRRMANRPQPKQDAWMDEPVLGHSEERLGVLGLPLPKPDHDLAEIVLDLLASADPPPLGPEAQTLARAGRGGDSEIGHLTPGEIVIPQRLQTPEVMSALQRAARATGAPLARMQVGHAKNRINPNTGAPEFDDDNDAYLNQDPSPRDEGAFGGDKDQDAGAVQRAPDVSSAGAASDNTQLPSDANPVEEITVTGKPIAQGSDADLLARAIAAEAEGEYRIPNAMEAVGFALRNRMGQRGFQGGTDILSDVLNNDQVNAVGTERWKQTGDPAKLKDGKAAAYARALQVADGIFNGTIKDPTGGAMYYYSGAPSPFFQQATAAGKIVPAPKFGPFSFYKDNPALKKKTNP